MPPGGEGGGRQSKGPIIALVIGGVIILGLIIWVLVLVFGGGDDNDDPAPTATAAAPTQEDTPSAEPSSEEPTSEESPSEEPTPEPTEESSSAAEGGSTPPLGYAEIAIGQAYEAYDFEDYPSAIVTVQGITPNADCNSSFASQEPGESYFLLDLEVGVPAEAEDSYTMIEWEFGSYSDSAALETTGSGLFCQPANPLPSDIQPGASVTGQIIIVVPDEATWITYEPLFSLSDNPGAAWRVQR